MNLLFLLMGLPLMKSLSLLITLDLFINPALSWYSKKSRNPFHLQPWIFFFLFPSKSKWSLIFDPIDNCIDNYRPDKFLNSKFSNLGIYPILIFIKLDIEREFKLLFQLVPISQMTWLNFDWNIFFIRVFPTCY